MSDHAPTHWRSWQQACQRDEVVSAFTEIYADMADAIKRFGPTCWSSGKCCKFDSYGHRLYVTGLEIAHFLHQHQDEPDAPGPQNDAIFSLPQAADRPLADACRYQREGKCTVHPIRPLGCRVFFCQQGTERWQQDMYESLQKRIVDLHHVQEIPYHYMEWRRGLIEAERWLSPGISPSPGSD